MRNALRNIFSMREVHASRAGLARLSSRRRGCGRPVLAVVEGRGSLLLPCYSCYACILSWNQATHSNKTIRTQSYCIANYVTAISPSELEFRTYWLLFPTALTGYISTGHIHTQSVWNLSTKLRPLTTIMSKTALYMDSTDIHIFTCPQDAACVLDCGYPR